jgi:hypothetical protein
VDLEIQRQRDELMALTKARNKELTFERKKHEAAVLLQKLFRGFTIRNAKPKPKKDDGKKKK